MSHLLSRHPASSGAALRIDAEARRKGDALILRYVATGALAGIALPAPAAPARRDELWRRTCFEAFLRGETGDAYFEFNVSPSTEWAAWRFAGYRDGMAPLDMATPRIEAQASETLLTLEATLALGDVEDLPAGDWRVSLAAVIEETSGNRSYWALKHPPGKPDFHHSDCFALRLPAASGA